MKTSRYNWILAASVFLSCDAIFPPKDNPDDCTVDATVCDKEPGSTCDAVTHKCLTAACSSPVACGMPTAVECVNNSCVACDVDTKCIAWVTSRHETIDRRWCRPVKKTPEQQAGNTCVQCWPAGMPLGNSGAVKLCDEMSANPTCDIDVATGVGSGLCRPCRLDSECGSGICRKPGDYPAVSPVPGLMTGQCVLSGSIAYVDKDHTNPACSDTTGDGTKDKPFCTVMQAMSAKKAYIRLAGATTNYTIPPVSTGSFVIVGPGRDATPAAKFDTVSVTGGSLVLSGLQIGPTPTVGQPHVICSGASSSIYLLDTIVMGANMSGRGINTDSGCQLTVERSRVEKTGRFGISVEGAGSKYRIVNTAVVLGGSGGEPHGVRLGTDTNGYFGFNTVTKYLSGVICESGQSLEDSIVSGNTNFQVTSCNTDLRVHTGPVSFEAGFTTEPKLVDNAANQACCIDKAPKPSGNGAITTDYYGTPRPQRAEFDIGYYELP